MVRYIEIPSGPGIRAANDLLHAVFACHCYNVRIDFAHQNFWPQVAGGGVHFFPREIRLIPLGASNSAQIWIWIWRQRWRPDPDPDSASAPALEHASCRIHEKLHSHSKNITIQGQIFFSNSFRIPFSAKTILAATLQWARL